MTAVSAILKVLANYNVGDVVTTASVRDAIGTSLSVDKVGRILSTLGLKSVKVNGRRGWRVTNGTLCVLEITKIAPVNTSKEETKLMFLKVYNLSANYVTLLYPDAPDKAVTLQPHQVQTLDLAFADLSQQAGRDNKQLMDLGIIRWEKVEQLDDSDDKKRQTALAMKLADPTYEGFALQILLFEGETLEGATEVGRDGLGRLSNPPTLQDKAGIVKLLLTTRVLITEGNDKGEVDVNRTKATMLPFLKNILDRERMWRNRPALVSFIEQQIKAIESMEDVPESAYHDRAQLIKDIHSPMF